MDGARKQYKRAKTGSLSRYFPTADARQEGGRLSEPITANVFYFVALVWSLFYGDHHGEFSQPEAELRRSLVQ